MSGTSASTKALRPYGGSEGEDGDGLRGRARAGARLEAETTLGPRGVGQLLDAAFDVLVARFGYLFLVTLLVWLPISLAAGLVLRAQYTGVGFALQLLLPLAGNALTVGLVAPVVVGRLTGREPELGVLLQRLSRSFLGLISVVILSALFSMPFACLCGVGVLVGLWLTSVAPTALVVEGLGPLRALFRSLSLTAGVRSEREGARAQRAPSFLRWFGWFIVASLLFLPASGLSLALDAPAARSALQSILGLRGASFDLVVTLLSGVFVALSTAYTSTCVAVYYVDCRVRTEGLDLALTLDELEAAS